jgi:hypothetical protein
MALKEKLPQGHTNNFSPIGSLFWWDTRLAKQYFFPAKTTFMGEIVSVHEAI